MKAPEFPKSAPWLNTDRPVPRPAEGACGAPRLLDLLLHQLPARPAGSGLSGKKVPGSPFLVIGVHAAKFDNEQDPENIRQAIIRHDIEHPVVVDNGHEIWNNYSSGPGHLVLIGADGRCSPGVGEGLRDALDRRIAQPSTRPKDGHTRRGKFKSGAAPAGQHPPFPGKWPSTGNRPPLRPDSHHHRILELKLAPTRRSAALIGRERGDGTDRFGGGLPLPRVGGAGNKLYVCDTDNHKVREIVWRADGRTLAGNGKQAMGPPEEGPAPTSPSTPPGTAVGNRLYIAMAGSHQLWS